MNPQEIGKRLVRLLSLDTRPVGVKLYEDSGDTSHEPLDYKLNVCQLVGMARYGGEVTLQTSEKMVCSLGAACLGLIATPEPLSSGRAALGSYADEPEAARRFMQNTHKLGDQGRVYDALLVGPLAAVPEEPDVIVVYGSPAQVMRLVHACTYDTGEKVSGDTVAEGALCSAIAYAIEEGEARYDIPCAGDRKYGGVHRDELVFCMPYSLGERVTQNLEKLVGDAGEYMVPPTLSWTPSMSPDFTVSEEELE